jgi:hypothetical protein
MRPLLLISLVLFTLATVPVAEASHDRGVEMYYTCLGSTPNGNCTIRVTIRLYADCGSVNNLLTFSPAGAVMWSRIAGGCAVPTGIGSWTLQPCLQPNGQSIAGTTACSLNVACASLQSQCTNPASTIPGWALAVWERDYIINSNCVYTFSYSTCCRNNNTTNIVTPATISVFMEVNPGAWSLSNLAGVAGSSAPQTTGCVNSSPRLRLPHMPIGGITPDRLVYDPDGDSLVFRFGTCYESDSANSVKIPVAYAPGFSPGSGTTSLAIPSLPQMSIDPNTGVLNVNPIVLGSYLVCYYIDEYRNGIRIGSTPHDLLFNVTNGFGYTGPANNFPRVDSVNNRLTSTNSVVYDTVCAGQPLHYRFKSVDVDTGQTLTLLYLGNIPGSTFTSDTTGNPIYSDFNWNNPIARNTPYQFSFVLSDDGCPTSYSKRFFISVLVFNNANPTIDSMNTLSVAGTSSWSDTVCANTPIVYRFRSSDLNSWQKISMAYSGSIPGASFNVLSGSNPAYSEWAWNTPIANTTPYQFVLSATDSACGGNPQTFTVSLLVLPDTVQPCGVVSAYDIAQSARYSLYPNPASNRLMLVREYGDVEGSLSLYNANGQQVLRQTIRNTTEHEIEVGNLTSGIYYLRLDASNRQSFCQKVLISR